MKSSYLSEQCSPGQRLAVSGSFVFLLMALTSRVQAQTDWQPIECVPADLPVEKLYERVAPVADSKGAAPQWTVVSGAQLAKASVSSDRAVRHGGSASLRVEYEFIGKKDYEYVQLSAPSLFSQTNLGLGFWVKHDGTPFAFRLRVLDKSGECHQFDMMTARASSDWQFVACSLESKSLAWGGDGNKRKDFPCRLSGIIIDRPKSGFVGKGSLWIDEVALVRPAKPKAPRALKVETQGRRFGNLFAVGEAVTLRASGEGERIRWSVKDFFGCEMSQGEGPASATAIHFALKQPGWFCCRLELLAGSEVVVTKLFPCAALAGGAESARSDFVGVCTHLARRDAPMAETLGLMQRYGLTQFRDEIPWGSYEREQGQFAMPAGGEALLKRAAELNMHPLLILDYANRFYDKGGFPNSPEAIAAYGRYALDLVQKTRGVVNMFEIWNEWVGGCGMQKSPGAHGGEDYGRLLQPTYRTLKAAAPGATFVGIGGEYGLHCAENILGALRTAGTNSMDAWSIHPYRYPFSPEFTDLAGEVTRLQSTVAQAGEKSPAWVTEIGYPTHCGSGGSDEWAQARYAVRTLVLLQSSRVEKVFWYDLKDDGLTRDYNEHNFGLMHHERLNCAPKPGLVAFSAFIRFTGGAEFKEFHQANGVCHARYRSKDGADVVVLWSPQNRRAVGLAGKLLAAYDLMGNAMNTGPITEATENPVYCIGQHLSVTAAQSAF